MSIWRELAKSIPTLPPPVRNQMIFSPKDDQGREDLKKLSEEKFLEILGMKGENRNAWKLKTPKTFAPKNIPTENDATERLFGSETPSLEIRGFTEKIDNMLTESRHSTYEMEKLLLFAKRALKFTDLDEALRYYSRNLGHKETALSDRAKLDIGLVKKAKELEKKIRDAK